MAQIRFFDMLEPKEGATTANYLGESLIPEITVFTISGRPVWLAADHTYLFFEVKVPIYSGDN